MNSSEIKAELRLSVRRKLDGMSGAERARQSQLIRDRIAASEFGGARCVLAYLAFPDEVDLDPLLAQWIAAGRKVAIPRMDWEASAMTPIRLANLESGVETRRHGVREPLGGEAIPSERLDLVIVPGMSFDERCARVGRGGGFYDRFLGELRRVSAAPLVGVAFDEQIVPNVPIEEHDVAIDAVVTPTRWFCAPRSKR